MTTVAIVGAGDVAGAAAQALASRDAVRRVLLVDANQGAAAGKALDIRQSGAGRRIPHVARGHERREPARRMRRVRHRGPLRRGGRMARRGRRCRCSCGLRRISATLPGVCRRVAGGSDRQRRHGDADPARAADRFEPGSADFGDQGHRVDGSRVLAARRHADRARGAAGRIRRPMGRGVDWGVRDAARPLAGAARTDRGAGGAPVAARALRARAQRPPRSSPPSCRARASPSAC